MPSRKRRSSQPATQGGDTNVVENKNEAVAVSNAEAQEELRGEKGTDAGLANYEQALGKWLGPELYKAVAPHLTLESIASYATEGLAAALEGSVGALGQIEGDIDKAALDKFGTALSDEYSGIAGDWVEGKGSDFAASLADWVDAHPRTIVAVALLAAAGAILADADIPTLKQKFKIADGLTAKLEADLGSLRAIALEKIGAEIIYASGPLSAAMKIEHSKGGDNAFTGSAEASLGDEERKISADATFTDKGIQVVGVEGLYKSGLGDLKASADWDLDKEPTIEASLTRKDGKTTMVSAVDYDANTGVLDLKDSRSFVVGDDGPTVKTSLQQNSSGESSGTLGVDGKVNENTKAWGNTGFAVDKNGKRSGSLAAGFGYTDKDAGFAANASGTYATNGDFNLSGDLTKDFGNGLKGGANSSFSGKDGKNTFEAGGFLNYADKEAGFSANTKGSFATNGDFSLSGDLSKDFGNGLKGGANSSYANKDGKSTFQAGGFLDYADKEGDRTRGSYNFNSENNEHRFGLMHEETLSERVKMRGTGNLKVSDLGTAYDASIHGAYRFNENLAGIAGGRFETGVDGRSSWIPEVGVQVNDVPLVVGYDTRSKSVRVGLSLKF